MTDEIRAFGGQLRARRTAAGLSQQDLADRSGLSVRAISNLERGRTRWPYRDSLLRLADALALRGGAREEFLVLGRRPRHESGASYRPSPAAPLPDSVETPETRVNHPPRHLPAPVPGFVGREEALAELTRLLPPHGTGAPTLVSGTAGVGKTALAVQWAHAAAVEFPDGQLYVNLRGYDAGPPRSPADALAGLLRALGVEATRIPNDLDERAAAYRGELAGRRILLVLDNARDAEQVRPLLPGMPGCGVLVTSRDALAGLVARDGARRVELDLLPDDEALALLSGLIGPRARLEPEALSTLAAQCSRLPLALRVAAELAVARESSALAELVDELSDLRRRLDALDAGGDGGTAVRAVLSWSYRQLEPSAARMLRLSALHPGADFASESAAALTGTEVAAARRTLDRLAHASLVRPVATDRYELHDLLRAFARERAEEEDDAQARHAALLALFDHYVRTAGEAMAVLFPAEAQRRPTPLPAARRRPAPPRFPSAETARAWLDAERANLTAAVTLAAAPPQQQKQYASPLPTAGASPATLAAAPPQLHPAPPPATASPATLAASPPQLHPAPPPAATSPAPPPQQYATPPPTADASAAALTASPPQRHATPLPTADASPATLRASPPRQYRPPALAADASPATLAASPPQQNPIPPPAADTSPAIPANSAAPATPATLEARALQLAATVERYLNFGHHLTDAAAVHVNALRTARRTGDTRAEATALTHLGFVEWERSRFPQAIEYQKQALTLFRATGDHIGQARVLHRLSLAQRALGEFEEARANSRDVLRLCRTHGERLGQARALHLLGTLSLAQANFAEAGGYLHESLALLDELADQRSRSVTLKELGVIEYRFARLAEAAGRFRQARALCVDAGNRSGEAEAVSQLGLVALRQGRVDEAITAQERALAVFREIEDRGGEGAVLARLALAEVAAGNAAHAVALLEQALQLSRRLGARPAETTVLNGLGEALVAAGRSDRAPSRHRAALDIAARTGDAYESARAHHGLAAAHAALGHPDRAASHARTALAHYLALGLPEAEDVRAAFPASAMSLAAPTDPSLS